MAIVMLAVIIFLFDIEKKKRSVPLTKYAGVAVFKNSCDTSVPLAAHRLQIAGLEQSQ